VTWSYAFNLHYVVNGARISVGTVFWSAMVFLAIQALGLLLCILVPGIVTRLPNLAFG
jgi:TRAP-type mannitol/chloroaromatic compound transport system permease large subunit